MPADVIDRPVTVTERETAVVRAALHRLDDNQRQVLWQCLELVGRAVDRGDEWNHVADTVRLAPSGLVRDVCHEIAWQRFERSSAQPAKQGRIPKLGYKPRPLSTFSGRACDPDVWTSSGWTWRSFSVDALGDHVWRARRDPESCILPVKYRHSGEPLGFTRYWYATEDNGIDVEATLLPTARAQYAGRCVQDGLLRGLSLSTRIDNASWCHYAPNEWSPYDGRLDLERHHEVTPVELSLTPVPAQGEHSYVRAIW